MPTRAPPASRPAYQKRPLYQEITNSSTVCRAPPCRLFVTAHWGGEQNRKQNLHRPRRCQTPVPLLRDLQELCQQPGPGQVVTLYTAKTHSYFQAFIYFFLNNEKKIASLMFAKDLIFMFHFANKQGASAIFSTSNSGESTIFSNGRRP